MILTERDRFILYTVARFRFALGRHIRILCNFTGERACDRRLKLLIDNEYLSRQRMIYGIAGIYTVTGKAKKEFDLPLSAGSPRLDQIQHDISVIETAIYIIHVEKIGLSDIKTEKELRHEQGFSSRGHEPDLVYTKDGEKVCVEVELSLKAKDRLKKNINSNFLAYDIQKWVVPKEKTKIRDILSEAYNKYPNIEVIDLESITEFVKGL